MARKHLGVVFDVTPCLPSYISPIAKCLQCKNKNSSHLWALNYVGTDELFYMNSFISHSPSTFNLHHIHPRPRCFCSCLNNCKSFFIFLNPRCRGWVTHCSLYSILSSLESARPLSCFIYVWPFISFLHACHLPRWCVSVFGNVCCLVCPYF